jgi:protein-disulfide isomerase
MSNNILQIAIIINLLLLTSVTTIIYIEEIAAQQEQGKTINENSLAACVDYFDNEYKTLTPESVKQDIKSLFNENTLTIFHTAICDMGFEHTGKYSHLLSKDLQHKYVKLVVSRILLENKTFETLSSPTDDQIIINKLFSPVTVNASVLGDEQAKITIVEFADYQCPFCAKFHKETKGSIIKNFVNTGKVKFLFKDLIVNDRPNDKASTLAASASYCAAEQGKYWEYNDQLYKNSEGENTGWVTKDNLKQLANNIRIPNITKFSECIESNKYNNIVIENDSLAKNIGLTSTPTFIFYNGTNPVAVQGAQPYELFEQIINEML